MNFLQNKTRNQKSFFALVLIFSLLPLPSSAGAQQLTMCGGGAGGLPTPWVQVGDVIYYNVTNGQVGIGTSSPASGIDLHVVGDIRFASSTSCDYLYTDGNGDLSCGASSNLTPITLAGVYDYLTLSGQQITLAQIDLATDVTGTLDESNIDAAIARDSELHDTVTLSGAYDYLTLSGQEITRGQIDLATDITGVLDESNVDAAVARDNELHDAVTLGTNTASALSLSTQQLSIGDVFVQNSGDTVDGTLSIANNGDLVVDTDTLFVDASDDEVGINTSSPGYSLHVNGTFGASAQVAYFGDGRNIASQDIALQFGTTNPEQLYWDASESEFVLSDDLQVNGNLTINSGSHSNCSLLTTDANGVIGCGTDGGGDVTGVTAGSGITVTSSSGPVPTVSITTGGVTATHLGTNSVAADEIATDAVEAAEIAANAVGTSELDLTIAPTWTGLHTFSNTYTDFSQYIRHSGDTDTYARFSAADQLDFRAGNIQMLNIDETTQDLIWFNAGNADVDFRIDTDTMDSTFFVLGEDWEDIDSEGGYDTSEGRVSIGSNVSKSTRGLTLIESNGTGGLEIANYSTADSAHASAIIEFHENPGGTPGAGTGYPPDIAGGDPTVSTVRVGGYINDANPPVTPNYHSVGFISFGAEDITQDSENFYWHLRARRGGSLTPAGTPGIFVLKSFDSGDLNRLTVGANTDARYALDVYGGAVIQSMSAVSSTNVCYNTITDLIGTCSSSRRFKENIVPFDVGLETALDFELKEFDWKDGQGHDVGFIAEEVELVEPKFVVYDEEGVVHGVKYDRMTTVLVNALKEQRVALVKRNEFISTLEKEQLALQSRIEALKERIKRIANSK